MRIEEFSKHYKVTRLTTAHADAIEALCKENILYYDYCPPFVSKEIVLKDLTALPKGKGLEDKYFVGYYENEKLIAVMDVIDKYPDLSTAFIGFFMSDVSTQKQGIGTRIIEDLCDYLVADGYRAVRLAWVKGNPQSEHFWRKNQFIPIKETSSTAAKEVILAQRDLG